MPQTTAPGLVSTQATPIARTTAPSGLTHVAEGAGTSSGPEAGDQGKRLRHRGVATPSQPTESRRYSEPGVPGPPPMRKPSDIASYTVDDGKPKWPATHWQPAPRALDLLINSLSSRRSGKPSNEDDGSIIAEYEVKQFVLDLRACPESPPLGFCKCRLPAVSPTAINRGRNSAIATGPVRSSAPRKRNAAPRKEPAPSVETVLPNSAGCSKSAIGGSNPARSDRQASYERKRTSE